MWLKNTLAFGHTLAVFAEQINSNCCTLPNPYDLTVPEFAYFAKMCSVVTNH